MNIILAPHVDDECIGCFSLFRTNEPIKVLYFFEVDDKRLNDAYNAASKLRFDFHVLDTPTREEILKYVDAGDVLYIPNCHDVHPHHKFVNKLARTLPLPKKFYSTSMNVSRITLPNWEDKKELLKHLYVSQREFIDIHSEWYMFESILDTDLKRTITVKNDFIGFHQYRGAPTEVSFLEHVHRHRFYVETTIEVMHDDRELEFFMVQRAIQEYIDDTFTDMNLGSCEMMAEKILNMLIDTYCSQDTRNISVIVSEDQENSSTVAYQPNL